VSCAKTAEPIEMPFRTLSRVDPRNHVLDGVEILMGKGTLEGEGTPNMPDDTLA